MKCPQGASKTQRIVCIVETSNSCYLGLIHTHIEVVLNSWIIQVLFSGPVSFIYVFNEDSGHLFLDRYTSVVMSYFFTSLPLLAKRDHCHSLKEIDPFSWKIDSFFHSNRIIIVKVYRSRKKTDTKLSQMT